MADIITTSPILVTGGTGFIAGHIINQLLMKGYRVRTTVRSLEHKEKYDYLLNLPNAEGNLEIMEANLLEAYTWPKVFSGVQYVFHVAAPYILKPDNPELALMDPIVNGMKLILDMCQQTKTVQKLIITSCMTTLSDDFENGKEYNEDDWNSTSTMTRNAYAFCKTMAEKMAWSHSQRPDCSFKVVSILPFTVWGPHLAPGKISMSHRFLLGFLTKNIRVILNLHMCISDVRDVANAHILAMEQTRVVGRYCLCNKSMSIGSVLQVVHENFRTDVQVPTRRITDFAVRMLISSDKTFKGEYITYNLGRNPSISCFRALDCGMVLRPPVQTIIETVRYFLDNNILEDEMNNNTTGSGCIIA